MIVKFSMEERVEEDQTTGKSDDIKGGRRKKNEPNQSHSMAGVGLPEAGTGGAYR